MQLSGGPQSAGQFFVYGFLFQGRDWLRRHCAHSPKLTGVLKSAFRLWSNPFSSVLSLTALKTKKTPVWELFCFGTRTGPSLIMSIRFSQLKNSVPTFYIFQSQDMQWFARIYISIKLIKNNQLFTFRNRDNPTKKIHNAK